MSAEIKITFPDGNVRTFPSGTTSMSVAESISKKLAEKTLAVKVDGIVQDATMPLTNDVTLQILTWEDLDGKATLWHSSAHILAEAVQNFYPNAKFGIGPPIETGFYYDIDFGDETLTTEEFDKIEKKFIELANSGETFVRESVSKDDAIAYFTKVGDNYKLELIEGLEDGSITFYKSGNFTDLCRGPHIPNSKHIKAVKILNSAAAYWRGDSKNKQLTRLYAVSYPNKKELDEYLIFLEEAKKRDHRKLGKDLDLFSFHEEGPGFPFWHHKGMVAMNAIQNFLRNKLLKEYDYEEIKTPLILNEELWKQSGHYENYKENMYFVDIDETNYAVKPMNCPGSTIVYRTKQHSYRDLPLRMFEFGHVHRHELSGALMGLFRVRSFVQDDAHIFCTPEQIQEEMKTTIKLVFDVYNVFGFKNVKIYLSTRPDNYIGSLEIWDSAENSLKSALNDSNLTFEINEGDGAFYGPKIDFVVRDSLKRHWQLGTIQLDFSMPNRFDLEYIASDGSRPRPVMIHRAILGSFERFFGVLLEHTGGDLPFWMSPTQIIILPISDKFLDYCKTVQKLLEKSNFRTEIDNRNEKISKKIRDSEIGKLPFMLVVGEKEETNQQVSLRKHKDGDIGTLPIAELIAYFQKEYETSFQPAELVQA